MCHICNNTRQAALKLERRFDWSVFRANARWVKAYSDALYEGRKVTLFSERTQYGQH